MPIRGNTKKTAIAGWKSVVISSALMQRLPVQIRLNIRNPEKISFALSKGEISQFYGTIA